MRLFIGNLPFRATEDQLTDLFSQAGDVLSVTIVTDRETGRSRGFGFVEMEDDFATKAIDMFNGYELDGRALNVNQARPRPERGGFGSRRNDRY